MTGLRRVLPLLLAPALIGAGAGEPSKEAAPVRAVLTLGQEVYETGAPLRAELVLTNTSPQWVSIPDASDLVKLLRLVTPEGKELAPTKPEQFGAAKTKDLGPGGFVGVTFDATMLFPALSQEGQYKLACRWPGGGQEAAFRMIPAFDPKAKYFLDLATPDGDVGVELFARDAPVSVHNVVSLARTKFFDGANVVRIEPGVMLAIHGPVTAAHRITPFERTSTPYLAGAVLLDAQGSERDRASFPDLIVLLAPAPALQGRYTVVGQVVSGLDVLQKLASRPTTGKDGNPPFRPLVTLAIPHATVREGRPAAAPKG